MVGLALPRGKGGGQARQPQQLPLAGDESLEVWWCHLGNLDLSRQLLPARCGTRSADQNQKAPPLQGEKGKEKHMHFKDTCDVLGVLGYSLL